MNNLAHIHAWELSQETPDSALVQQVAGVFDTLDSMRIDAHASELATQMAKYVVSHYARRSRSVPSVALDPEGDVLLTWTKGHIKGSALVGDQIISSVVSEGTRLAYIGPDRPATLGSLEDLFVGLPERIEWSTTGAMLKTYRTFLTTTICADKSIFPSWEEESDTLDPFSTPMPSPSSSEMGFVLNP